MHLKMAAISAQLNSIQKHFPVVTSQNGLQRKHCTQLLYHADHSENTVPLLHTVAIT